MSRPPLSMVVRALTVVAVGLLTACGPAGEGDDDARAAELASAQDSAPAALAELVAATADFRLLAEGEDDWQVWVCQVPADTTAWPYAGLALRLTLTADGVAAELEEHVRPYFEQLSAGAYEPRFTPGGEIRLGPSDGPEQCSARALDSAYPAARGVIAVADAEHQATSSGGFGSPGAGCPALPCPAATTRRIVYVGASDFHPDWGEIAAVDLIEHELGHALGWPHSADSTDSADSADSADDPIDDTIDDTGHVYASALDVMSNSAAPRDTDPARRHAPGTLAVNRIAAGWLPLADVSVVSGNGGVLRLEPSSSAEGMRAGVVGVDGDSLLTVEVLADQEANDHLPASGVAVHLVSLDGPSCGRGESERCGPTERSQQPLVGGTPFTDLLQPGERWSGVGWQVEVLDQAGDTWVVEMRPTT